MANFNCNKVILGGRLTNSPELKTTESGVSVAVFSMAVNRKPKAGKEQETDFFNVTAWRQTAEFVSRYFSKGSSICVIGTIQNNTWTDQQNVKHYRTDIIADEVMFVDSKSDTEPSPAPTFDNAANNAATTKFENISNDDDLPF